MKRNKNLGILVVSLACGLAAAYFAVTYLKSGSATSVVRPENIVAVLVVKNTVEMGDIFTKENVAVAKWPKEQLSDNTLRKFSDLTDMVAASRLPKGVPITKDLIISKKENLATQIPKNHRAMTIDLTQQGGIPDFIEAGSFVDVIATFDQDKKNPISKTVIQNAKVMKITKRKEKDRASRDRVSLLLTMAQAERLSLAMARGTIRITLRNQADLDAIQSKGINSDELIWGKVQKKMESVKVGSKPMLGLQSQQTVEVIRGVTKKSEIVKP